MTELDCDVFVVGGGPVGLTLAGELGRRGIRTELVERRVATIDQPKATLLGSRSMEHFRSWGITQQIIESALPEDDPYFILFTTRLAEDELYRFRSPSLAECARHSAEDVQRFPELAWSPYSKTQIGQQALEPVLRRYVEGLDSVGSSFGWEFVGFTDTGDGVSVELREIESGQERRIRSRFLVACDGGDSSIRKKLKVPLLGRGRMRGNVSFYFRSSEFQPTHGKGIANLYFTFGPNSFGVFTAIDADQFWSYQHYFVEDKGEVGSLDPEKILFDAMGKSFSFELLGTTHWHHHQSVADQWRVGNVYLAGDAAHLFVPTGGVGMNTGIGDAVNLGWKLAAWLKKGGGDELLDSYQVERKPVAIRNSIVSANNSDKIDMVMQTVDELTVEASQAGQAKRQVLSDDIRWLSRQFRSAGVHLGYRYDSPVCIPDGSAEVSDDPSIVVPSTRPGARFPHFWIDESTSTLDLLSLGFTVFVQREKYRPSVENLVEELSLRGIECDVVALPETLDEECLNFAAILVRPDGHVCWRGQLDGQDWSTVVDVVLGRTRRADRVVV